VGQAILPAPAFQAALGCGYAAIVLQHLDFFSACDDFLVGQAVSPVLAAVAGVLVAALPPCITTP
jgi:hypothetical protein